MGNLHGKNVPISWQLQSKRIRLKSKRNPAPKWDKFFVALAKQYKASKVDTIASFNPKRVVFISVSGLYQTWKQCPPTSLYNALLILPLKRKWILSPSHSECRHQYSAMLANGEYLRLLRWKLSQNLLFCLLDSNDDQDFMDGNQLIAPVWHQISARLQALYDPITQRRYRPLTLDEAYWEQQSPLALQKQASKASNSIARDQLAPRVNDIILAMYALKFKFSGIAQLLLESNATLNVVTHLHFLPASNVCASASFSDLRSVSFTPQSVRDFDAFTAHIDLVSASLPSSVQSGHADDDVNGQQTDCNVTEWAMNDGFVWVSSDYFDDARDDDGDNMM